MSGRTPTGLEHPYDLIVIGAGINGAGIARDAALRGLRVLVLEQDDIGGATSAWNSRLVHGGLRYLEHAEIGLVRESLRDREILLRTASHLVTPLPLLIPLYAGQRRGPGLVRMGMLAYDLLSLEKSLPWHRMYDRATLRAIEPSLASEGLLGAARYYDAQATFPERLTLENLLCARANGATVYTHARARRVHRTAEGGDVTGVEIEDRLTGKTSHARSGSVINVAGPWVDHLLGATAAVFPRRIGGTKGTHIVVPPFPGAPGHALYAEAAQDGRPYFTLPWNGLYLIGTTDTRYDGDPGAAEATEGEIRYLLEETNRLIPGAGLTRDQVLYAYSGVRPLPYVAAGDTGAITRRHLIVDHRDHAPGLWSVIGGKLTTYRHLAEEAIERIGRSRGWPLPPCPTRHRRLPGAEIPDLETFGRRFAAANGLTPALAKRLVGLYGVNAEAIAERMADDPRLREVFSPQTGAVAAELIHAFEAEMAETLTDALMRRTMVGLGPSAGLDAVEEAARIAGEWLGWDRAREAAEVEGFRAYIARLHPGVAPSTG
ncbi:glycerol-3-phosphate dehydrogenase/oxidase [Halorhodospira halophila]|uniref:FAD dependent oxidoreductase n=1 Tax=Halorhodospira halophila (strain DSM 244 / SL1) TaxID=349124 RepID=A1WT62_HALHL|nr:glycerol-3-phosphate dehydrogenase/oxidase [Halorhodospira halophila]ABM60874.1 FAD dependent oxidoreductase [Halorhodospira halophila SL1]MBK1728529.1 glycerol-3-phosphate dehydrogenase/oxidase [Halorhodospira halophila]